MVTCYIGIKSLKLFGTMLYLKQVIARWIKNWIGTYITLDLAEILFKNTSYYRYVAGRIIQ